jgi:hypothetical protein
MVGTSPAANPVMSQPGGWHRAVPRPDRRNVASRAALLTRVIGEYREMPGLGLTLEQAARLFGLSPATCWRVLSHCVREGWLDCTADGVYKLVGPTL